MEFRILGPLQVFDDARPLGLGGPKQRAVLAHLILRANHTVGADQLVDGLWGDEPPETARNTLQTYVYRLRKVLGEERLQGRDGGYVLTAGPEEVDAARFEAIVKDAKRLSTSDPAAAATRFGDALALWRGAPLDDLGQEPSLRGEIARLEELHLSATEHRIAAEIASGRNSTVVSELEALTARYPLRERMWANLMLALYRGGRQAEALSTYQRARDVLIEQLGTEPSTELQRLHERILRRDPSLGGQEPQERTIKRSRVDLQPGSEFAGYRIVSTLGRGGMAVVYLAEHDFLQRKVALKVLAPQLAEDDRFRERFIRESRLAASLDHPNVVPIYEAGASGGDLFIAMRYVEGTDLRTLLAESGSLDPARTVLVTRQVAAALDAAHEQGLVHRDVKPGNVLVARTRGSEAGEHVYLSDFGLTKRSTSKSAVTETGQFVGTLDYAAPEQFQGGTPDARTDVYSLGCVLFECLSGHPPFRSENDAGLMYAHLQEAPPLLTAERPELPKEIDAVIARAMAKTAGDRQSSAGALASEATKALNVGAPDREDAGGRNSLLQRLVPALSVALAIVVAVVVMTLLQNDTPQPAASVADVLPKASPSPTVPPTFRTVDRALTDPERELLTFIPEGVAEECVPLDRPEPLYGERASLVCRTEGMEVLYQQFQTRDEMNETFEVNVNNKSARNGDCATDTLAVGRYTIDGELAGRVLCYTIERGPFFDERLSGGFPNQSHIEWTDDNASIYAHALRNDLGDLSLYNWWRTSSGPVVPSDQGAAVVVKDRPRAASVLPPDDGSYLATTGECDPTRSGTCIMHIQGSAYGIRFFNQTEISAFDSGEVVLRKPASIVFAPRIGYCHEEQRSAKPVTYTWTGSEGTLSFDRTGGGRCGGPGLTGPWTPAPHGVIAVGRGGEIELVDPAGSAILSPPQGETHPNSWPDWSPDGSKIVFSGADQQGFDLYVMNADGTGMTRLTNTPEDEVTPAWSPNGESIAFAFDDQGEGHYRSGIAVVRPDGTGRTEVVGMNNRSADTPTWSPDGSQIAYNVFTDGVPRPYVVDAGGGEPVSLLDAPGFAQTWTPDGDHVMIAAFDSLVTAQPDGTYGAVFMKYPPEAGRLDLDWSPDGRWIVGSSAPNTQNTLYLIRGDGSEYFQVGTGTNPSWQPDQP
jgi:serine/threonine protein kinase/DNA-binding SARP family transcriptional activator